MPEEKNTLDRAVELMVQQNCGLWAALAQLGSMDYTAAEAAQIEKRRNFQTRLWAARHRYYQQLAEDPSMSKSSLIGLGLLAVQHLASEGQWDKALEGILKLARIRGDVGNDTQVSVFASLSQKELDDIKTRLGGKPTTEPVYQA